MKFQTCVVTIQTTQTVLHNATTVNIYNKQQSVFDWQVYSQGTNVRTKNKLKNNNNLHQSSGYVSPGHSAGDQ